MDITNQIGARIRAARSRAKMSQEELARRINVKQSTISRAERGERRLSADQLMRVASVLGLSPADLMPSVAEPGHSYGPVVSAILSDYAAPPGLRDLASDKDLLDALRVTREEMETLAACPVEGITKDGYVQLLITLRAIHP